MPKSSNLSESGESVVIPPAARAPKLKAEAGGITKRRLSPPKAQPELKAFQIKLQDYIKGLRRAFRNKATMLNSAETFILFKASVAPTTAAAMSEDLGIDKAATARAIGKLVKLEMVTLSPVTEGDRRQSQIMIAQPGNDWLKAFSSLMT